MMKDFFNLKYVDKTKYVCILFITPFDEDKFWEINVC